MTTVDTREIAALALVFQEAARSSPKAVRGVVSRGALNVKRDWQKAIRGSRHFNRDGGTGRGGNADRSVSYDVRVAGTTIDAEVGPDRSRSSQARLLGIAHFGGANGGGGTLPDPQTFLDREASSFERYLRDAVNGLL